MNKKNKSKKPNGSRKAGLEKKPSRKSSEESVKSESEESEGSNENEESEKEAKSVSSAHSVISKKSGEERESSGEDECSESEKNLSPPPSPPPQYYPSKTCLCSPAHLDKIQTYCPKCLQFSCQDCSTSHLSHLTSLQPIHTSLLQFFSECETALLQSQVLAKAYKDFSNIRNKLAEYVGTAYDNMIQNIP